VSDALLKIAKAAHEERHPSHKVLIFSNHVDCMTCKKHAHVMGDVFMIHDASTYQVANPQSF